MEHRLLALWQEVLGINRLGVEDNYFELGGSSLMAVRLMAEVWRRFGVKLPLTAILESPTVRAFSRRLNQERNPNSEALIELRPGGPRKFFLVHDGDGETLLYLNLARRMPPDLAVFGIEPRRIAGVPLAHGSIEDMAAFYVGEVRKKDPYGPYLLGGMCAGGVIAYEMASQLVRAGETVELVALLDAAAPNALKKPWRTSKQRLVRFNQVFADAQKKELTPLERANVLFRASSRKMANALLWEVSHRSEQWSVRARFRLLRELLPRERQWPRFVPELTVRQIYNSAEMHYKPRPLSIPSVVLLRATSGEGLDTPYKEVFAEETLGWGTLAQSITVVDVDGGHSTMLQERFVDSLADALVPLLQQHVRPVLERSPLAATM
jgi:thioesterase domain-containing protein/acyl carrier protein